jgi:hypothetical protein
MFKRLLTWFRNRKIVTPESEVYGSWVLSRVPGTRNRHEYVFVERSKPIPTVKWNNEMGEANRPTQIIPFGGTTEDHKKRGQEWNRAWLVANLPDACTFL